MLATLLVLLAIPPTDLVALGTVVSPRPERSVAILRSQGRTRIVGLGATAFGGRVAEIGAHGVALDFQGERVDVRLALDQPTPAGPPRPVAPEPASPAEPPEDPATPHRDMDRVVVQRRLAEELPRILAETTLVPVTDAGQVVGFALTRVPQTGLLTDAGLRPGDVLTHINEVPIDGMGTLMGLWPRLQGESEIRAVVLRAGRPVTLAVTLR
jgi:type II secretory pathway component PulC